MSIPKGSADPKSEGNSTSKVDRIESAVLVAEADPLLNHMTRKNPMTAANTEAKSNLTSIRYFANPIQTPAPINSATGRNMPIAREPLTTGSFNRNST